MKIIAEKINGTRKRVAKAIEERDADRIKDLATKQAQAGAAWLDVNAGTHPNQEPELIAKEWKRAEGLAEDIRYYGQWMRDEAFRRISRLYPTVRLPEVQGGGEATVIAWLWARTVTCPNPACGADCTLPS